MTADKQSGPPPNVPASELWTLLTTLPRPHKDVAFPRRHPVTGEPLVGQVSLVVLTESELMSARAAADEYAKAMLKEAQKSGDANLGYLEIYRNESIVEVVCRACRTQGNLNSAAFPNPALARKYMTSDEFLVLFTAYCDFQAEAGPIVSHMDKDEMNAWIDRLTEGASLVPLAALSSDARNRLLLHSVSLLQQSRTGNGSPGLPPDEPFSSTSQSPNEGAADHPSSLSSKRGPSSPHVLGDGESPPPPVVDR